MDDLLEGMIGDDEFVVGNTSPNIGSTNTNQFVVENTSPNIGLINTNQFDIVSGVVNTGDNFETTSKYDEGISYQNATSPRGIAKQRHEKQGAWDSLGSALVQTSTTLIGELMQGTGALLDLPQYGRILNGTEKEFNNWFSQLGSDLIKAGQEAAPIYQDPDKEGGFNPGDWTWWMGNAPSIISTFAFMIPGMAAAKAVGLVGKAAKFGKYSQWALEGISGGLANRYMESTMEANATREEIMQLVGKQLTMSEAKEIEKNYGIKVPGYYNRETGTVSFMITEDIAKEAAGRGAANNFRANTALGITDIPQFLLATTPFGKTTEKITMAMARKLGKSSLKAGLTKTYGTAISMGLEGAEEGYQYISNGYSKEIELANMGLVEKSSLSEYAAKHIGDGEFATSVFFGALGAGVMMGGRKLSERISKKLKGDQTDSQKRLENVSGWFGQMNNYTSQLEAAEKSNDKKAFDRIINDFTIKMSTEAADNENSGHLIDLIERGKNATEEDKAKLIELGFDDSTVENIKKNGDKIIERLKKADKLYQTHLNNSKSRLVAKTLTGADMNVEHYSAATKSSTTEIESLINDDNNWTPTKGDRTTIAPTELKRAKINDSSLAWWNKAKEELGAELSKHKEGLYMYEEINRRLGFINDKIEELELERKDIKSTDGTDYDSAKQIVDNDNFLFNGIKEIELTNAIKEKTINELELMSNMHDSKLYRTKEGQDKLHKLKNRILKDALNEALAEEVEKADNIDDIEDAYEVARDNGLEDTVTDDVKKSEKIPTDEELTKLNKKKIPTKDRAKLNRIAKKINAKVPLNDDEKKLSEDNSDYVYEQLDKIKNNRSERERNKENINKAISDSIQENIETLDSIHDIDETIRYLESLLNESSLNVLEKIDIINSNIELLLSKIANKSKYDKTNKSIQDKLNSLKFQIRDEFQVLNDIADRISELKEESRRLSEVSKDLTKKISYYKNLLVNENMETLSYVELLEKMDSIEAKKNAVEKLIDKIRKSISKTKEFLKLYINKTIEIVSRYDNIKDKKLSTKELYDNIKNEFESVDDYSEVNKLIQSVEDELNNALDDIEMLEGDIVEKESTLKSLYNKSKVYSEQLRYLQELIEGYYYELRAQEEVQSAKQEYNQQLSQQPTEQQFQTEVNQNTQQSFQQPVTNNTAPEKSDSQERSQEELESMFAGLIEEEPINTDVLKGFPLEIYNILKNYNIILNQKQFDELIYSIDSEGYIPFELFKKISNSKNDKISRIAIDNIREVVRNYVKESFEEEEEVDEVDIEEQSIINEDSQTNELHIESAQDFFAKVPEITKLLGRAANKEKESGETIENGQMSMNDIAMDANEAMSSKSIEEWNNFIDSLNASRELNPAAKKAIGLIIDYYSGVHESAKNESIPNDKDAPKEQPIPEVETNSEGNTERVYKCGDIKYSKDDSTEPIKYKFHYGIERDGSGKLIVSNTGILNNTEKSRGLVDQSGIDNSEYKLGTKAYIEQRRFTNKRGFSDTTLLVVVYKDGNINNKSSANRKVLGELQILSESNKNRNIDLYTATKTINEWFNANNDGKDIQIYPNATITISGMEGYYTNNKKDGKPVHSNPNVAFTKSDKHNYAEDSCRNAGTGFLIGYTGTPDSNGKNKLKFNNGVGPEVENFPYEPGEIIFAIPNRTIPGTFIIVKGFKDKISQMTNKKAKERLTKLAISKLEEIFEYGTPNKDTFKGKLSSIIMLSDIALGTDRASNPNGLFNIISKDIPLFKKVIDKMLTEGDNFTSTIPEENILRDNIMAIISDGYAAFDSKKYNSTVKEKNHLSLTDEEQTYNEIIAPYLSVTTIPGHPMEKVQLQFNPKELLLPKPIPNTIAASKITKEVISTVEPKPHATPIQPVSTVTEAEVKEANNVKPAEKTVAVEDNIKKPTITESNNSEPIKENQDKKSNPFGGRLRPKIGDNNNSVKTRQSPEGPVKDAKEELEWFAELLPNIKVGDLAKIQDKLSNVLKNGHVAWGAFYNASIWLRDKMPEGTVYHEAFHVIFNLALNDDERLQLLNQAEGETLVEKEEWLADKFAKLLLTNRSPKSLKGYIAKVFRQLHQLLKALWGSKTIDLQTIIYRVERKYYVKLNTDRFSDKTLRLFDTIDGWSYRKSKNAVNSINNHIVSVMIPFIRSLDNSDTKITANMTDSEIMNVYAKYYGDNFIFYRNAMDDFIAEADNNDSVLTQEEKDNLRDLANHMFGEDGKPMPLIYVSIIEMNRNNNISTKIQDSQGNTLSLDDFMDSIISETNESKEVYDVNFITKSNKNDASFRVKNTIRYLTKPGRNEFGLQNFVEYDKTYNTILKDLEGIVSVDEIIPLLTKYSKLNPEYIQLIEAIKTDKAFATDMLQAFGRAKMNYTYLYQSNGKYLLLDANSANITNVITQEWNYNISNNKLITTSKSVGNESKRIINTGYTNDLYSKYINIIDRFISDEKASDNDINEMVEILRLFGLNVSKSAIKYISERTYSERYLFFKDEYSSLNTIFKALSLGKNPFDSDASTKENRAINNISKTIKEASPELFESSHISLDGEKVFSHIIPTFLTNLSHKLKTYETAKIEVEKYMQDQLFRNNPIIIKLNNIIKSFGENPTEEQIFKINEQLKDVLSFTIFEGINDGKDRTTYTKMRDKELQAATINSYFNNGSVDKGYFRMPALSDSGNMIMVRYDKETSTNDSIIDKLLLIADAEYERITASYKHLEKNSKSTNKKNYHNNRSANTKTGYKTMPMFNGFEGKPSKNADVAKRIIKKYFNELTNDYYESMLDSKCLVLSKDGKSIDTTLSKIDSRIISSNSNIKEFLNRMLLDTYMVRASVSQITIGDAAFYQEKIKDGKIDKHLSIDFHKRAKEIFSPKINPDINAKYIGKGIDGQDELIEVKSTYNSIYLSDEEIPAPSMNSIMDEFDRQLEKGIITKELHKAIETAYKIKSVNRTDAQAFITLPFYRKTMISYGMWNDALQAAYNNLISGNGSDMDMQLVMQPIKPFMFTQIYDKELGVMVPVQHKNSEFLLLPQLVNKPGNEKIKNLMEYMIKNDIGVANFSSAVKTGLSGEGTFANPETATIHTIPTIDRGIQQPTPEHFIDSEIKFGTQIRKIIMSNLKENSDYVIGRNGINLISKKANDLYSEFMEIIESDLRNAYEDTEKKFYDNGRFSWKKVADMLSEEAIKRDLGENFSKAIKLNANKDGLSLPMFDPLFAKQMESLLTSIFNNNITKQKINGGAFVQTSDIVYSDGLKIVFDTENSKKLAMDFEDSKDYRIFEEIKDKAKLESLIIKGYTSELWDTLTKEEQEHALNCA